MVRKILFALLALGPITVLVDRFTDIGDMELFVLAALALIPLAWLIGDATEQAAHHTGPGIGGFLNATFGNAPELIIALIAVNEGLFEVVRGSLTGSVVGNLLLVLGFSLLFGGRGELDRTLDLRLLRPRRARDADLPHPGHPRDGGRPGPARDRRDLGSGLDLPAARLRGRHEDHASPALDAHAASDAEQPAGWSLKTAIVVLSAATVVTAFVAETLVHTLEVFSEEVGLSEFFVAAVIVAIVGNAAEHGGAVVVAYRGKLKLAAEIALASSAQVAVFLIPAVTLLSWLIDPLASGLPPGGVDRPRRLGRLHGGPALERPLEPPARRAARGRVLRRGDHVLHRRRPRLGVRLAAR